MRVMYVNPIGSDAMNDYFREQLEGCAGPDVEIEVTHLPGVDKSEGPFLPRLHSFHGALLDRLREAEARGYDAAVIGCSGDPVLFDARRLLRIPVTAPLEAALHAASLIHPRVAILVADGFEAHILYQDLARSYGLLHMISEILTVPMQYPDPALVKSLMASDESQACKLVLDRHLDVLGGPALELATGALKAGAGVIYAGCTLWTGQLDSFARRLGAPVIDPGRAAVVQVAAAARLRAGSRSTAGVRP
jgi:allantoin racemase